MIAWGRRAVPERGAEEEGDDAAVGAGEARGCVPEACGGGERGACAEWETRLFPGSRISATSRVDGHVVWSVLVREVRGVRA